MQLSNKYFVLIRPPVIAGSVLLIRVRPSILLSGDFLGISSLDFSEIQYGVKGPCDVVHLRAGFFCFQNGKNGPKKGFLEFMGKFRYYFFLNLVYKETLYLYQLLYFCTNPILGKNVVPEIWAKMLSAN